MVYLATSWFGSRPGPLAGRLPRARELGFEGVALLPGDPEPDLEGWDRFRSASGERVPAASWDALTGAAAEDLSALEAGRREQALARAGSALGLLHRLGGEVLILAPGVPGGESLAERDARLLARLEEEGALPPGDEALEEVRGLAARDRERHLEALARSIVALLRREPGLTVALALEPGAGALLDLAAAELLLGDSSLGRAALWYDTGAAGLRAALGLEDPGAWLDRLGGRIAGATLHDHAGGRDGLPPGAGETDWPLVAEYLPRRAWRVLLASPSYPGAALAEAVSALAGHGLR